MAYSTSQYPYPAYTPADPTKQYTPASGSYKTGAMSYQATKPQPMYSPAPAPKAATTPMYQAPKPNPSPLVQAVTAQPAPKPAPAPTYDFSRDALTAAANRGGSAQAMSQQAEDQMKNRVIATSQQNPGVLQQGAQMGATPSGQGVPSVPTYFQAYTGAPSDTAMGGNSVPPAPPSPTVNALQNAANPSNSGASTQQGSGGGFRPEIIDYGNGKYGMTRQNAWDSQSESQLNAYKQELNDALKVQYANPATAAAGNQRLQFLQDQIGQMESRKSSLGNAQDTSGLDDQEYAEMLLTDPNATEDSVSAARRFVGLTGDSYRRQAERAAVAQADAAQAQINNNFKQDRDRLVAQLAARGLSATDDSQARKEMADLEFKYRELQQAEQAKAQAAVLAADDKTRAYLTDLANKRIEEKHKQIADQVAMQNAKANAYAKETASSINWEKLGIAQDANEIKRMLAEGKISESEASALLKNAQANAVNEKLPGEIDLNAARANQANATADYTSGAKTANTEAKTATENALRDAKLAKLKAEAAKISRSGTGSGGKGGGVGKVTDEELLGAQELFQGQGGTGTLSGQKLADAVRLYRASKGLASTSTGPSPKSAVDAKAAYKKATTVSSGFQPIF